MCDLFKNESRNQLMDGRHIKLNSRFWGGGGHYVGVHDKNLNFPRCLKHFTRLRKQHQGSGSECQWGKSSSEVRPLGLLHAGRADS